MFASNVGSQKLAISDENIIIIDSIVVIVVMNEIEQVENGSFQNQTESPLARRLPRRAGRLGPPLWERRTEPKTASGLCDQQTAILDVSIDAFQ
jgi:hypothetical protein